MQSESNVDLLGFLLPETLEASPLCICQLIFAAGRGLQMVNLKVGGASLLAATTHLESPLGHNNLMSAPRVAQCNQVRS